eukprot:5814737-Prymnesium_polylepis.1
MAAAASSAAAGPRRLAGTPSPAWARPTTPSWPPSLLRSRERRALQNVKETRRDVSECAGIVCCARAWHQGHSRPRCGKETRARIRHVPSASIGSDSACGSTRLDFLNRPQATH